MKDVELTYPNGAVNVTAIATADRHQVAQLLAALPDVADRLGLAWSGGNYRTMRHEIELAQRILTRVEEFAKDDLWRNLPVVLELAARDKEG